MITRPHEKANTLSIIIAVYNPLEMNQIDLEHLQDHMCEPF